MCFVLCLPAQNSGRKLLTMEETVMGRLSPQSRSMQWKGNVLTYVDKNNLVGETADKGKESILLTLDELSKICEKSLNIFPYYQWNNKSVMSFNNGNDYFEIDVDKKELKQKITTPEKISNRTYNGYNAFAYTIDNNLYYVNANGKIKAITTDNDKNIVNGQSVSRNEFGINGGIFWSPDGKHIAFYRKDESSVGTFPLLDISTRTGTLEEIKYPMAGMSSEKVALGVHNTESEKTVFIQVSDFEDDRYITNVTWSPDSKHIYAQILNREQKHMRLNQYLAETGAFVKTIFEEKNDKYIEPLHSLIFLKANPSKFIYITNNRDGYFNLYLCDLNGNTQRLTNTDADVKFVAEDEKFVYYTSAEVSPIENHLFCVEIKSGKKTQLTQAKGWHSVKMSADNTYFIDQYSNVDTPNVINLVKNNGKFVRELHNAQNPAKDYNFGEITLGTLKSADGKYDNYYRLIKPINFDTEKKYPVIVYVYGGPHSQMVKNTWLAGMGMWEMYMAQQGYVVFVMDNRGTSNRGAEFEKEIHKQCGQAEMADQIKGIDFLKSHAWVNAERIGVHGWSYGGFMTISLMTNYPDVFKVGVAGGPVIDWQWYEVMYGERYMDSPQNNLEGYQKTSLINSAKNLKGKLLICQGVIDPVVLWQHSLNFTRECIKNNIQLDYFPYPRAEHNVGGRDRIHLMQKITNYFQDYL